MGNHIKRLLWLTVLLFTISGCVSKAPKASETSLRRFEFQKPEMGLPFRIVLYAPDEKNANEAVAAAFKRIEEINDLMSDYDPESELSRLSASSGQGKAIKVSDELWFVLQYAQKLSRESEGAFDITVGPVVQLWRKVRRERKLPDPIELTKARASVGYQWLRLNAVDHTAMLIKPGMKLDLGGIAKGYANDQALKVLREHHIRRALISGGGDMAVGEAPPGKNGWRIELAPLDVADAPPTSFASIKNCGFATSGDLFQHVEIDGKRYSHIVDPRTGFGLTDHGLVIVIAPDCMTADSLAKPAGIMDPATGIKFLEKHGAAARIARKPGEKIELVETRSFQKYLDPSR
jgi:thiamine biosynthesis lipoprotein